MSLGMGLVIWTSSRSVSIGHEIGYQVVNDLVNMRRRTNICICSYEKSKRCVRFHSLQFPNSLECSNNVLKVLVISVVVCIGLGLIQLKSVWLDKLVFLLKQLLED